MLKNVLPCNRAGRWLGSSCLDERSLDLRRVSEIKKIIESHKWRLAHFDDFGDSGVIVRYSCMKCSKEWTTFLLDPESVRKLKY